MIFLGYLIGIAFVIAGFIIIRIIIVIKRMDFHSQRKKYHSPGKFLLGSLLIILAINFIIEDILLLYDFDPNQINNNDIMLEPGWEPGDYYFDNMTQEEKIYYLLEKINDIESDFDEYKEEVEEENDYQAIQLLIAGVGSIIIPIAIYFLGLFSDKIRNRIERIWKKKKT